MKTLHYLFLLPLAVFPFLGADKPEVKPDDKAAATAPVVPPNVLAPLENIVRQLAKGAREREVKDLLRALEQLGYPKANIDKLAKASRDDLAKAERPLDSLPAGAKQLRVTAAQLVAIMEKIPDEDQKKEFAAKILQLDGDCAAARTVLGHEKVGKSWVASELKDLRVRRGEILQKIEEAKKLDVDMDTEENVDDVYIEKACGVKATEVKRGSLILRSNFSAEKTQRIMREAQRAWALSYWLRHGELKLMPAGVRKGYGALWILIDSREMHMKLSASLRDEGKLKDSTVKLLELQNGEVGSFQAQDGTIFCLSQIESFVESNLLESTCGLGEGLRTPLTAGHINWITLTCFGCRLPVSAVKSELRRGYGDTKVAGEDREREELLRMAEAGIAGSRTWMQYLAGRNEDPLFGKSLVEALGLITGNDLHKCTSIVEFLQESNTYYSIYKKLGTSAEGSPVKRYEAAMEMTFGELETNWRNWLLGAQPGVAERIDKENLNAYPPDALAVLKYMNQIREATFKGKIEGVWTLKFDPDLSEQCAAHAHYLTLHPEQQKWPDAHEEYADKEGYTVEGAWAGAHAVILFGNVESSKKAIDGWMGTFYHRLPLIDPGVLRLGWGQEEDVWVLDMSSLAAPYRQPYLVLYPYDGQTGVPTAFDGNEFPDPVPEEGKDVVEAEIFGYPITIQTNPVDEKGEVVDIVMKLLESKDDKEVDCHFSSPLKPTNPELSPGGVWCLIPKTALRNKTEYKVVADWRNSNKTTTNAAKHLEWKFKTE